MSKPIFHAISSARLYGGIPDDYIDIHLLMDSSKTVMADNRHRALTHNSFFVNTIIEKIFGVSRTNSDGRIYSTKQIAEQHVLEDYNQKYIPTAQDFLGNMSFENWMDNGRSGYPPSHARIHNSTKKNCGDSEFISFSNID